MWYKRLIKSYLEDTQGNFALMFGALSVPILLATGMAIDISRMQSHDRQLQDAVDAAALFAVTYVATNDQDDNDDDLGGGSIEDDDDNDNDEIGGGDDDDNDEFSGGDDDGDDGDAGGGGDGNDDSELEAATKQILAQNLTNIDFTLTNFELKEYNDGSVSLTVNGKTPAFFAQINGFPSMAIAADAGAQAESGGDLEVSIAFDTTNSMGFDNTWTNALNTLDTVLDELDEYTGDNNFFVSLVPFSDRVNVGTTRTNWIQGSTPPNWNGCVEPREENNGTVTWALDDDKPTGQNRFQASIPGTTGGLASLGSGFPFCPSVAIVPPTNNVQSVITAAGNFTKSGTGRFDVGMAWMWRMISSEWRGHWSAGGNAAANARERRKIAIMITDGRTEAYTHEVDQTRDWSYNQGSRGGFENMVAVCDGMKADGLEIFMVRVDGNANASTYMKQCATNDDYYFEISDNADLEIAFKDILKVVRSNVVLTQ